MTSSTALSWRPAAARGAGLLAIAAAVPVLLPFAWGALSTSLQWGQWAASPTSGVVEVLTLLSVIVGGWLLAAPVSRWWRVVVVVVAGLALFGTVLRIGGPSRFDLLVTTAHWLSYAELAVQGLIAILGLQIERRVGAASPLWLVVVVLLVPLLLSMLTPLSVSLTILIGAVGVLRSAVLALALVQLRARLRRR